MNRELEQWQTETFGPDYELMSWTELFEALMVAQAEKAILVQALTDIHTAVNFENGQLENFIAGQSYTALAAVYATPGNL